MITTKIKSIKKVNDSQKVYDIEVEDAHHYILSNGVVSHNSYFPTKVISGGSGLIYAASTIIMLSKRKDKDGKAIIGNIIRATTQKSRLSKENQQVELKLNYMTGLDKYYGLLDLAEKYDIIKKVSTRYELPDGTKVFGKKINENPEEYFTDEIMALIEVAANKEFKYGRADDDSDDSIRITEDTQLSANT